MASFTLKTLLGIADQTTSAAGGEEKPAATTKAEPSLFAMSDKKIMDLIYESHVHTEQSYDDASLFAVVENILNHTTRIVDKVVQGIHVHADIEEKIPKGSVSVPLCTLKQICSEMSCKAPSEETPHKVALSILNNLRSYTWEAKAVLTLAAFAMEYGDFWLLAQLHHSHVHDPMTKSLEILNRVPAVIRPLELQKRRQTILELNDLVKATLQVIELIYKFEDLSKYDPKDLPALSVAAELFPVDVYWVIRTLVACTTKLDLLAHDGDEYKSLDVSPYSQKIQYIINKFKIQLLLCKKQIEELDHYRKLCKLLHTPTEIVEIFKALILSKDNVLPQHRFLIFTREINIQPLIDGSTNRTVKIDVLKRKNVFIFVSGLDITEKDISVLYPIYEGIKNNSQYKIVWMPIVEQWNDDLRRTYERLRVTMPWYSVHFFSRIAGFRFIKEKWNFKGKPLVVAMNPQGKVENPNALHLIRVWGMKAFPFDKTAQENVSQQRNWIGTIVRDIDPVIPTWINEQKYIFFYGGKDKEWRQQVTKKVTTLASDLVFKEAKISIELFRVGKTIKGDEEDDDDGILGRFWSAIEGLFITNAHKEVDPVSQEIQKLLSYKNESGWFVLSKGSTVVLAGHGYTILRVFEEFNNWKAVVKQKGFEVTIKEYHSKALLTVPQCCRLDIPATAGAVPETIKCPECTRVMDSYVSYKCCHVDGAHH